MEKWCEPYTKENTSSARGNNTWETKSKNKVKTLKQHKRASNFQRDATTTTEGSSLAPLLKMVACGVGNDTKNCSNFKFKLTMQAEQTS